MITNYLDSVMKQFRYYKMLGEKTFDQCDDRILFAQSGVGGNSIGVIVNHMAGNMLSRWTDYLISDGEKEWRNRDQEFEPVLRTRAELIGRWDEGWECVFNAMESVNAENITAEIFIRNQGHTLLEAINRQLCHYSYHVGQIVLIGKSMVGHDWQSLSIPKGESHTHNTAHFNSSKTTQHFTDDLLL